MQEFSVTESNYNFKCKSDQIFTRTENDDNLKNNKIEELES